MIAAFSESWPEEQVRLQLQSNGVLAPLRRTLQRQLALVPMTEVSSSFSPNVLIYNTTKESIPQTQLRQIAQRLALQFVIQEDQSNEGLQTWLLFVSTRQAADVWSELVSSSDSDRTAEKPFWIQSRQSSADETSPAILVINLE